MVTRLGIDAGCDNWPNTNAISCLKRADGSWKPEANALTASTAVSRSGGEERSRRANIARYRWKRGSFVSSSVSCSSGIACFSDVCGSGGAGSMDAKSLYHD